MVATIVMLPFSINSSADSETTSIVSRAMMIGLVDSLIADVRATDVIEFFGSKLISFLY